MNTVKIHAGSTRMIAHRGLSALECENTAAAFVAAGNRSSYFGIETDVHKTLDGKFIIIHDDSTERVAEKDLSVEGSRFDELRAVRLYDKQGEPRGDLCLPTLREYLKICRSYGKKGVLELKNAFEKQDIAAIVQEVRDTYSIEEMIFISFDYRNLVCLRELEAGANIQYLWCDGVNSALIGRLKERGMDLDIAYQSLKQEDVALLHENGILVNCWTVDDKAAAERLAGWGVDFITSNILEAE